jgi:hypothetical protein
VADAGRVGKNTVGNIALPTTKSINDADDSLSISMLILKSPAIIIFDDSVFVEISDNRISNSVMNALTFVEGGR